MDTNLTLNGGSSFRIKRPLITTSGFASDVDPTVKQHLERLNTLLGRRIFTRDVAFDDLLEEAADKGKKAVRRQVEKVRMLPDIRVLLAKPLTAERVPEHDWAADSLLDVLSRAAADGQGQVTLADHIDATAELSALKYAFQTTVSANWFKLDGTTKIVLDGYPAITDYLVAYAYHVMDLQEVNGVKNFVLSNRSGVKSVAGYAIVSAARTIIARDHLKVAHYNNDDSVVVKDIRQANLSLTSSSFETSLKALIHDLVFDSHESNLIDSAGIGTLPAGIKPLLIKYVRHSPVPITHENVKLFLPLFISQIAGQAEIADPTEVDVEASDKDFDVQFIEDDGATIMVSKSAVKCAAQLYYGMILGDELDVFNTVNYFTHKYLVRGSIEIQDARLREDLQMYVFSNRFTDLKTKRVVDRTRPAERLMFYRQVFNYGAGQVTEDVIVNTEFTKLWTLLILESAKYLERAQAAYNPDSYVSRQNVMQAVEDLQYNLSTHCTGMSNVITPLIYAELDFVIRRIFMHPEVLRQVAPQNGTWWRVVEAVYMGMKNVRPKATVLYNKAKIGHDIIRSIAEYNPSTFEDDKSFSAFISNVDAFITTQSILQEALADNLKRGDDEAPKASNGLNGLAGLQGLNPLNGMNGMNGMNGTNGMNGGNGVGGSNGARSDVPGYATAPPAANGGAGAGDWDF